MPVCSARRGTFVSCFTVLPLRFPFYPTHTLVSITKGTGCVRFSNDKMRWEARTAAAREATARERELFFFCTIETNSKTRRLPVGNTQINQEKKSVLDSASRRSSNHFVSSTCINPRTGCLMSVMRSNTSDISSTLHSCLHVCWGQELTITALAFYFSFLMLKK